MSLFSLCLYLDINLFNVCENLWRRGIQVNHRQENECTSLISEKFYALRSQDFPKYFYSIYKSDDYCQSKIICHGCKGNFHNKEFSLSVIFSPHVCMYTYKSTF